MAHAILGGAVAALQGNNAAAGAAGAVTGELAAKAIMASLYPGKTAGELDESQKQTISTLATISAGMAGGLTGDSTASAAAGAQGGKNAVENNSLSKDKPSIFDINPMMKMGVVDENGDPLKGGGGIAKGGNRAVSSLEGAKLKEYYRLAEKYGQAGVKELENGNYRFYGDMTPSRTTGEMAGARLVREWDPKTGQTRTWYETLDHAGNIRSVAPKPVTNDKNHHIFDADGNYQGRR
ncbi:VENN motif pre-toxin domain-containing protein [Enterobacter mori]